MKDIILTKEDEEDCENKIFWRFCQKKNESDKFTDHCHLTGKYRGPAHNKYNINVTQKQGTFLPFIFQKCSIYDCHLFFKKLVEIKNDKVKSKSVPKLKEEYISVRNGCFRFIDSYRFLSSSLDNLVKHWLIIAIKY